MKYFRKEFGSSQSTRWYSLHLQTTVFGGVDVVCRWGTVSTSRRGERVETFPDPKEALKRLQHLSRRRMSRGFSEIPQLQYAA
jgi:predicted DNA-binding WGR domain protein